MYEPAAPFFVFQNRIDTITKYQRVERPYVKRRVPVGFWL